MISEKQMEREYRWKRVCVSSKDIESILGDFEEKVEVVFKEFDRARRESWIDARGIVFLNYDNANRVY